MRLNSPFWRWVDSNGDGFHPDIPRRRRSQSVASTSKAAASKSVELTLSQEGRKLAHSDEAYQQAIQISVDNENLRRAQAKADSDDGEWTPSQGSSFSRTDSEWSAGSTDDSDSEDISSGITARSHSETSGSQQFAWEGASPPGSTVGDDTTNASDTDEDDDEQYNDEDDDEQYNDEEYNDDDGDETDTDSTSTRSRSGAFPEDTLKVPGLLDIGNRWLTRESTKNPHKLTDELQNEYRLTRQDIRKALRFAEEHWEEWGYYATRRQCVILAIAKEEWPHLLETRY